MRGGDGREGERGDHRGITATMNGHLSFGLYRCELAELQFSAKAFPTKGMGFKWFLDMSLNKCLYLPHLLILHQNFQEKDN